VVFARHGYAGADVQDIADTAGLGKGTVYRHFPCKRDLFLAAVDHRVEGLGEYIDAAVSRAGSPLDRMRAATEAYIRWTGEHPGAVDLVLQEMAAFRGERKPRWFVFRDRRVLPWRDMFGERMAAGEFRGMPPERITDIVSDALFGLMFSNRFVRRGTRPEDQAEALLDVVLNGIRRAPGAPDGPAPRRGGRRSPP
jgi:AcrR family transcriptional regulator